MVVVGGSIPLVPTNSCKTIMPNITLPNGQIKAFDHAVSAYDVAHTISPSLAKSALAAKVDGRLVDLSHVMTQDCELIIITAKDSEESLEVIRHSTAHLLAQAVKLLFPQAQVTIGPVIEDGFYYDFAFERPFTPEDLSKIEAKMVELVQKDEVITRRELSRADAIAYFTNLGESYKAKIIHDLPDTETLSLYRQGEFEDLCRGPHVPSTGKLKAFKLTKLAGVFTAQLGMIKPH